MSSKEQELFDRWVIAPIKALRELKHGDGTFAVLSMAFGLYERFIDSRLSKLGIKADPENFRKEAAKDFGWVEHDAWKVGRFWDGFRLGMQHAFQPKAYIEKEGKGDRWGWDISEDAGYGAFPEIVMKDSDLFIVTIDPWKFLGHVLKRWEENPELINQLSEFRLGEIQSEQSSSSPSRSVTSQVIVQDASHTGAAVHIPPTTTGIFPSRH